MLKRRLQQVRQAVASAGDNPPQQGRSASVASADDVAAPSNDAVAGESEGFLCPVCMVVHASPEALQAHYESAHAQPQQEDTDEQSDQSGECIVTAGAFTCPACFAEMADSAALQQHFSSIHERPSIAVNSPADVDDLRAALKEEKWYASALKKELDTLQLRSSERAAMSDRPNEDEAAYYVQQIEALEAGKSMVTSRMLEFEKEISTLKRIQEGVQREKERILEKSALTAKEFVQLKAQLDEESTQKVALGEEHLNLKQKIGHLEKQLDQRPSEDDVDVLRKELIHAQTLMDTLTREREAEMAELKVQKEQLVLKCTESERMINMLTDQLNTAPKSDDLQKLQASVSESTQKLQDELSSKAREANQIGTELKNTKLELEEARRQQQMLQSAMDANRVNFEQQLKAADDSLKGERAGSGSREQEIAKLQADLSAAQAELTTVRENSSKRDAEVSTGLATKDNEIADLKATLERTNQELTNRSEDVEKMEKQISELETRLEAQAAQLEDTNTARAQVEMRFNDCQRLSEKKDGKISELSASEAALRDNLDKFRTEQATMLSRIEEGEGTAEAITQLSQEKAELQGQITQMTDEYKESRARSDADVESLHGKLNEKSAEYSALQKEFHKVENNAKLTVQSAETLETKLTKTREQLKDKQNGVASIEAAMKEDRQQFEAQLHEIGISVTERSNQVLQLTKELRQAVESTKSKDEHLSRMEQSLAGERENLRAVIQKFEIVQKKAEENAKQLIRAEEASVELRSACAEKEQTIDELNRMVSTLENAAVQASEQWSIGERALQTEKGAAETATERLRSELNQATVAAAAAAKLAVSQRADVDARALHTAQQLAHCQDQLQAAQAEVAQFELKLSESESSRTSVTEERDKLDATVAQLRDEIQALLSEADSLKSSIDDASLQQNEFQVLLESARGECAQLENSVASEKDQNLALTQELSEKVAELERLRESSADVEANCAKLNEDLLASTDQNSALSARISDLCNTAETMKTSQDQLVTDLACRNESFEELAAIRLSIEGQLTDSKTAEAALREEMLKLKSDWEERKLELEQANAVLQSSVDAQLADVEQALQEAKNYQDAARSLKSQHEAEMADLHTQLSAAAEMRSAEATEAEKQREGLENQLHTLTDSLDQLRTETADSRQRADGAGAENRQLAETNAELQAQMAAWTDEKRAMLERCVRTESDLDVEREQLQAAKRRFDDAVSAMHELGRENQTLQIGISKYFNRQWAEDSQAVNCNHCGKEFTLTFRRHHCRNCGLIFCADCSNRTATVPSAKKAVRVCDTCFTEINSR